VLKPVNDHEFDPKIPIKSTKEAKTFEDKKKEDIDKYKINKIETYSI
jgi:hypothetical protein